MKACGLIVEYNPFHNGHLYHVQEAKKNTKADCMIAVMSGSFLQRGEPAIMDKFHRTKAALQSGVDLVLELPYMYAVQSSQFFAKGALLTLHALHTDALCFGSESGSIQAFLDGVNRLQQHKESFNKAVQKHLQKGFAYPKAIDQAYRQIGIEGIDLFQPNNILGFSYVQRIMEDKLPIEATTIKRKSSHYHDETISNRIASATSIRTTLQSEMLSPKVKAALPKATIEQLTEYKAKTLRWHDWEAYFPLLYYKIISMTREELREIHGVDEGIEGRIIKAIKQATSFSNLIERVKTKRYTQVRLQRMFVHLLTNTKKKEVEYFFNLPQIPYIRLLGMTSKGQAYLRYIKKNLDLPLIANLNDEHKSLFFDERALAVYYAILPTEIRQALRKQEFQLPIMV